jgi:hypothetical protein
MPSRKPDTRPCPDQERGARCEVCGAAYVCVQTWRKEPTPAKRLAAKREQAARRKRQ